MWLSSREDFLASLVHDRQGCSQPAGKLAHRRGTHTDDTACDRCTTEQEFAPTSRRRHCRIIAAQVLRPQYAQHKTDQCQQDEDRSRGHRQHRRVHTLESFIKEGTKTEVSHDGGCQPGNQSEFSHDLFLRENLLVFYR